MTKYAWYIKILRLVAIISVTTLTAILMLNIATMSYRDLKKTKNFANSIKNMTRNLTSRSVDPLPHKIEIYYEVLCPYSRDFIVQTFIPTVIKLKGLVDFEMIPYGHAETRKTQRGGTNITEFRCQHGSKECDGNMIHSCVIGNLNSIFKLEAEADKNDHLLGFIGCSMINNFADTRSLPDNSDDIGKISEKCATSFDLDWEQIHDCWKGGDGDILLAINGVKTGMLQPSLNLVPLVVFNNSQAHQHRLRYNLFDFLCAEIGNKTLNARTACEKNI